MAHDPREIRGGTFTAPLAAVPKSELQPSDDISFGMFTVFSPSGTAGSEGKASWQDDGYVIRSSSRFR